MRALAPVSKGAHRARPNSDIFLINVTAYPNPVLNQAAKFRQPHLNLDDREDKQLLLAKAFQYP